MPRAGINRKTGNRWRYGRKVVGRAGNVRVCLPITEVREADAVSERFLSEDERIVIADLLRAKKSLRAIARELGRHPATISLEVGRNRDPRTGMYHPIQAQRRASVRCARFKGRKIRRDPELEEFIQQRLDRRWSPVQICQALRAAFLDEPDRHLAHETIYQAVYLPHRGDLERTAGTMRTGRPARRRHRRAAQRATRFIAPGTLISHRPAEVDDRAVAGHREGDLIVGTANRSAIGTLVDRTTRYVKVLHLPDSHSAENVREALLHGLLRQYFPNSTDLSIFSAENPAFVAAELDSHPHRTLGRQTPADFFAELVAALQ
ncbi:IS30 family transposase [Streptomyces sp. NR30]|uniref:IS30 family transposase n=1 Tax=Streptomyces guryensis TaxID=2886947 RepID=A0A9Q3W1H5_9ACTN|nr:IS30 family transposase [Streptomyces guryensis]MCD9880885.1 IS30 family transposase [Streptomyces guryensis]